MMRTILLGFAVGTFAGSPALADAVPPPPFAAAPAQPSSGPADVAPQPAGPEPEAISLERVAGLAREALSDISDGATQYGGVQGFSSDYADATRGLLDTLIGEWAMGGQIASIVENGRTDRLVKIRDVMVTARQDNQDFVRDAQEMSLELESTTDAISFRQQQIVLYGHLRHGLDHDRKLYERVLALSAPGASISSEATKPL